MAVIAPIGSSNGDYTYDPFDAAALRAIVGLDANRDYDTRLAALKTIAVAMVQAAYGLPMVKADRTDRYAWLGLCHYLSADASEDAADKPEVYYREDIDGTESQLPADQVARVTADRRFLVLSDPLPVVAEARIVYQSGPLDDDVSDVLKEAVRLEIHWRFNGAERDEQPDIDTMLAPWSINRGI